MRRGARRRGRRDATDDATRARETTTDETRERMTIARAAVQLNAEMVPPMDDAEEANGAWNGSGEASGRRARARDERLTRRRRRRFGFRDRGRRDGRKRRRDVERFRFERCEVSTLVPVRAENGWQFTVP